MDFNKILLEERRKLRHELLSSSASSSTGISSKSISKVLKPKHQTLCSSDTNVHTINFKVDELFKIEDYRVGTAPNMFYVQDVISEEDEIMLSTLIEVAGEEDNERWRQLRNRRLQCWGNFPLSGDRRSEELASENEEFIPIWLENIINELIGNGIFDESLRPNNILVNQYTADQGILHHTDGPIYHDKVAILSLQSDCLMTFRSNLSPSEIGEKYGGDLFSVLLRRRSLLVFSKDVYSQLLHGIEPDKEEIVIGWNDCECVNKEVAGVEDGDTVRLIHA